MENVTLSKSSVDYLYQIARWARFIALLGYIFIGLLLIISFFMGFILQILNRNIPAIEEPPIFTNNVMAIIYLAIALLYFFPVYYLFRFSNELIKAFKAEDEVGLNASLEFLKKHYKFIGILLIVMLAFYAFAFAIGIIASLSEISF